MSDFKCLTTGDLNLEDGFQLVEGAQEIRQRITRNLKTFLGEWFLDTSKGLPFTAQICDKGVDLDLVEGLIKREILNTEGVLELESFSMSLDKSTRVLSVSFQALTDEGTIEGEV